jgi:hypothetical protein
MVERVIAGILEYFFHNPRYRKEEAAVRLLPDCCELVDVVSFVLWNNYGVVSMSFWRIFAETPSQMTQATVFPVLRSFR